MILEGKTVLVTGVGGGLGRECAAAALRDGANVVIAARSADTLATIAAELDPTGRAGGPPRDRHHRRRLVRRPGGAGQGALRLGRRPGPGGRLRERLGRALRHEVRGLAVRLRDQRARGHQRHPAGGGGHEGGRRRGRRPHRVAVDVRPADAPGRLRGVQERPAVGHVLPVRRARSGQHPLQHGDPLVDVGPAGRDAHELAGQERGQDGRRGARRRGRASSRCAG